MARRLLVTYLAITAFALAVVMVPLGIVFADREHNQLVSGIERDAHVTASLVEEALEADAVPQVGTVLSDYAKTGGTYHHRRWTGHQRR